MKRTLAAVTALTAVLCATVAWADGHRGASPWNGFYIGGHVGYGWGRDSDSSIDGFLGGIQGGYNWTNGHVLVGVEGDFTFSGMNAKETMDLGFGTPVNFEANIDWLWSIRARLGFLATRNLLLYGTVGFGGMQISASATAPGVSAEMNAKANGLVAGGGIEYAFANNLLGRVEGLFYNGKGKGELDGAEADVTVIRGGLSYRF